MYSTSASWPHNLTVTVEMLYCRMFVEWFSQKMVGPLFIFSFDSSTVRAGGIVQNTNGRTPTNHGTIPHTTMMTTTHSTSRRSDSGTKHHKAVTTCQESARPAVNSKKTRPHSSTSARHSMQSAGCVVCQSTTTQSRTPQMTASTSTTSTQSRSTPNSNSTQQASNQATPAATD